MPDNEGFEARDAGDGIYTIAGRASPAGAGENMHEPGTNNKGAVKRTGKCSLASKTTATFLGYLGMGAGLSILGPTLLSMATLHNTDIAGISWSFTSMRVGGLIGALLCGISFDCINRELLLALACYFAGIAQILAPFTGVLLGFVVLMGIQGMGLGFLDAGSAPYLMLLWEGSSSRDTVIHAMSVFSSLGQFLCPLAIRDFLVTGSDVTSDNATGCAVANVSSVDGSAVPTLNTAALQMMNNSDNVTAMNPSDDDVADVLLSRYAYVMIGCVPLLGAVASSFNFIVFKGYKRLCTRTLKKTELKHERDHSDSTLIKSKKVIAINKKKVFILIALSLYMVVFNWLESNPGAFLSSFVVKGLCMDMKTGSDITSVYWGCHGLGRFITIFASKWIPPKPILIVLLTLGMSSAVLGIFVPMEPRLVWGAAILAGLGASSIYFSTVLWISDYVKITGKVSALTIIFLYGGGAIGPLFVGNMFQKFGYMWVIYIHMGTVISLFVLFVGIEVFAKINKMGKHGKFSAGDITKELEL